MRRLVGIAGFVTIVVLGGQIAPTQAVECSYLIKLMREIQARLESSSSERALAASEPLPWSELKGRFDRICGKVQAAPDLTDDQLLALIADCDFLSKVLEHSENPQAKVFLKRIKMCRDFFVYSLELREAPAG
jgi:hypothetical protein